MEQDSVQLIQLLEELYPIRCQLSSIDNQEIIGALNFHKEELGLTGVKYQRNISRETSATPPGCGRTARSRSGGLRYAATTGRQEKRGQHPGRVLENCSRGGRQVSEKYLS